LVLHREKEQNFKMTKRKGREITSEMLTFSQANKVILLEAWASRLPAV